MKKTLLALACLAGPAAAADLNANPIHKVKLANGLTVGVEACDEGIFRIKASPRKDFSESLMERYGIVRSDWDAVRETVSDKGVWTLRTGSCVLSVNRKTGAISVKDAGGSTVLREVKLVTAEDPLCGRLAEIINDTYKDLHVYSNGGIIGDDKGQFSEKDKAESGDPAKSSVIRIALEDGERFYGGGSTSRDHIQHRGEMLRMWTTYQHTEIPMPFVMSSRGWGIFNNATRKNFFDIGRTDPGTFHIYNTGDEADFYLMIGGSMPEVLDAYTRVTGRPYPLPKWAYGLCFGPNMREDQWDILRDAVMFRQFGVPCDVFWLEPQWMAERYDFSTKKTWNYEKFSPEPYWLQDQLPKKLYPRLFVGKLRSMGFHLGLWLCEEYDLSVVEEDEIALREGRDTSGREHWMDHLKNFIDLGIEGFKLDPARTIDEHTFQTYCNGRTDKEMHNLNQVLLLKQMNRMTREHTGKRLWYHYTAGYAGTQHWGASTSGDNGGGKTALFDQLNLGNSGYMNTSCDVMSVERELEMPSLHFGLFLPWVQINSWFSMMHPFYYDEAEQAIYRDYVKLRYSLMPYIYSAVLEGTQTGMPIVRSMPLMFPGDRACDDLCYQYMFGQNLCVGIFSNEIYLPEGVWTDAWTGEKIVSRGQTVTREYPSSRAGLLFVREGAILPCQEDVPYIGTKPVDSLILKVFPHGDSEYVLREDDGDSYEYENGAISSTRFVCREKGGAVQFTVEPVRGSYRGMPRERTYSFEIRLGARPASVTADGRPLAGWTFEDGILRFALAPAPVDRPLTVQVD